ncbi:MAG: twin-arginine translocation signal domain-containing protein [Planctomycetota bacterium]
MKYDLKNWTRRRFLQASGVVAASCAITVPGCIGSKILVPVFEAVGIEVVAKLIVEHFGYKLGGWFGGETIQTAPQGLLARNLDPEESYIISAFEGAYANLSQLGKLASPVLDVRAACGGKIAFMQKSSKNSWLVSGANHGVYHVAEEWVKYLIERNSCDLIIAGNTTRNLPCPYESECEVHVSKQEFQYFDGRRETLYLSYPTTNKEAESEHENHSVPFEGCPEIKV